MATARFILRIGNPILRAKAQEVEKFDKNLKKLVEDMWETMRVAHGTGLAAPQIGLSIRVLVAKHQDQEVTLINPEIIETSKEELVDAEGCLSIPGFTGLNIRRAASISVKGCDVEGKDILLQADGWLARVLQHEIDHLDGILYIDRLDSATDLRIVIPQEIEIALAAKMPAEEPTSDEVESRHSAKKQSAGTGQASKHASNSRRVQSRQPRADKKKVPTHSRKATSGTRSHT